LHGLVHRPELQFRYFGNSARAICLAQSHAWELAKMALSPSLKREFDHEYSFTSLDEMECSLKACFGPI